MVTPGTADEYHDYAVYTATSDLNGYFRLPAIHRLAQVRVDVFDGVTTTPFFVNPEHDDYEQWLDLRLQ